MQIYALPCGHIEFARQLFFPDATDSERMIIPVAAYLISHPQGTVLFDTGVHPSALEDPLGRLGQRIVSNYTYSAGKDDNVVSQLESLGLKPRDISYVINSHLHFDHCGGNEFFPNSVFIIQKREMDAARSNNDPHQLINISYQAEYRLVEGEHDLFGDGSLRLIPTSGHSPGHQSLLVQMKSTQRVLLLADACYTRVHLQKNILPVAVWNESDALASLALIRQLEEEEKVQLYFGHDSKQWRGMRTAPHPLV